MHELGSVHRCEVLLVGAGPIGLELAGALKRHGVDYVHIEAGNVASTIGWYSAGTQIFSSPDRLAVSGIPFLLYPGVRATREDYLTYLLGVVAHDQLRVDRFRRLVSAERTGEGWRCGIARSDSGVGGPLDRDAGGESDAARTEWRVEARSVILATGNMHRARRIGVPGEDLPHVSHFLGDIHDLAGCRVAIVGGRNSAAEAAVRLARLGTAVTMCTRQEELDSKRIKPWILPDLLTLAREGAVRLLRGVTVKSIDREGLVVAPAEGGKEPMSIAADRVLLLTGYVHSPAAFELFGLATQPETGAPVLDEVTMAGSSPGVFVVGTAVSGTPVHAVTHFIENSHVHVGRVLKGLGLSAAATPIADRPEDLRES